MKVFAPMLGLDPDSSLGGEVYDANVLAGLACRGHVIDVILRKGQKAPKCANIRVRYFPFRINAFLYSVFLFPVIFIIPSFRRIISESDVFRVHSPYFLGFWAVAGRLFFRKYPKILFHYHHIDEKAEMKMFDRFLPRHVKYLTFLCKETREDLKKRCDIGGTRFGIVPPGIDTSVFRPVKTDVRKELGICEAEKMVLFVGALIPRKGIDVLMKSWDALKKHKDFHLVVIGQGPLRNLIKGENVHYVPYLDKRKLAEHYSAADVFAFPTRLEGFGMTAGEAMACGTLVVTTNAKGVRNIVDGRTGFRVDVDDVKGFTEKIEAILADDRLREEMGKNAIKRIRENFTWDKTVDETERFLERLMKHD